MMIVLSFILLFAFGKYNRLETGFQISFSIKNFIFILEITKEKYLDLKEKKILFPLSGFYYWKFTSQNEGIT